MLDDCRGPLNLARSLIHPYTGSEDKGCVCVHCVPARIHIQASQGDQPSTPSVQRGGLARRLKESVLATLQNIPLLHLFYSWLLQDMKAAAVTLEAKLTLSLFF